MLVTEPISAWACGGGDGLAACGGGLAEAGCLPGSKRDCMPGRSVKYVNSVIWRDVFGKISPIIIINSL